MRTLEGERFGQLQQNVIGAGRLPACVGPYALRCIRDRCDTDTDTDTEAGTYSCDEAGS